MEYLEGQDLQQILTRGQPPLTLLDKVQVILLLPLAHARGSDATQSRYRNVRKRASRSET
jgi:hypothetical protein